MFLTEGAACTKARGERPGQGGQALKEIAHVAGSCSLWAPEWLAEDTDDIGCGGHLGNLVLWVLHLGSL